MAYEKTGWESKNKLISHLMALKRGFKKHLTEKEQQICELALENKTYKAIGLQFGLTKERVRQIVAKCYLKLCLEMANIK